MSNLRLFLTYFNEYKSFINSYNDHEEQIKI